MGIPEQTYFEQHAEELLSNAGINKAKFAELMGIARQNVLKLFETKNVLTLAKAASVLGVPLELLIYGHKSDQRINGFVEVDGVVHKIRSREDIKKLLTNTTQNEQEQLED